MFFKRKFAIDGYLKKHELPLLINFVTGNWLHIKRR